MTADRPTTAGFAPAPGDPARNHPAEHARVLDVPVEHLGARSHGRKHDIVRGMHAGIQTKREVSDAAHCAGQRAVLLVRHVHALLPAFDRVCGPNEAIGFMSMIDSAPRSSTARVRDAVELSIIDQRKFRFMVDEVLNFAVYIMGVMARRIRGMSRAM